MCEACINPKTKVASLNVFLAEKCEGVRELLKACGSFRETFQILHALKESVHSVVLKVLGRGLNRSCRVVF